MVRRSLKRRIEEIYSRIPPPLEELPIERWVAEIMEAHAPPRNQYDEDFWCWLEEMAAKLQAIEEHQQRCSAARPSAG